MKLCLSNNLVDTKHNWHKLDIVHEVKFLKDQFTNFSYSANNSKSPVIYIQYYKILKLQGEYKTAVHC